MEKDTFYGGINIYSVVPDRDCPGFAWKPLEAKPGQTAPEHECERDCEGECEGDGECESECMAH
jgi:hypothetical protein